MISREEELGMEFWDLHMVKRVGNDGDRCGWYDTMHRYDFDGILKIGWRLVIEYVDLIAKKQFVPRRFGMSF